MFDPDEFIGREGWMATSNDIAYRGLLAHSMPLDQVPLMTMSADRNSVAFRDAGSHPAVDGSAYDYNADVITCTTDAQRNASKPVCFVGVCVQGNWTDKSRPIPFDATIDTVGTIEHIRMTGSSTDYHFWISTSVTGTP